MNDRDWAELLRRFECRTHEAAIVMEARARVHLAGTPTSLGGEAGKEQLAALKWHCIKVRLWLGECDTRRNDDTQGLVEAIVRSEDNSQVVEVC